MTMRIVALIVLLFSSVASLAQDDVVVVLPLSSTAVPPNIASVIDGSLERALTAKGWRVAPSSEVESFLEAARVRYLDSLSTGVRESVKTELGARAILVGSVLSFREASDHDVAIAVSARLFDTDGEVIWAEAQSLATGDTEGALGSSRPPTAEALTVELMHRLTKRIPPPSGRSPVRLNRTIGRKAASTYRSASLEKGSVRRVCVLPFTSAVPEAVEVFSALLTIRLEATGQFDVVEAAELRDALAAARFPSVSALTSAELAEVGRLLGTTVFLRGQIHTYRHAPSGRSEVHMDMNLSDVASGRVLWAVTHHRTASEYSGLLGRGVVSNAVTLADRVVSEAIATQYSARARSRSPQPAESGQGR